MPDTSRSRTETLAWPQKGVSPDSRPSTSPGTSDATVVAESPFVFGGREVARHDVGGVCRDAELGDAEREVDDVVARRHVQEHEPAVGAHPSRCGLGRPILIAAGRKKADLEWTARPRRRVNRPRNPVAGNKL